MKCSKNSKNSTNIHIYKNVRNLLECPILYTVYILKGICGCRFYPSRNSSEHHRSRLYASSWLAGAKYCSKPNPLRIILLTPEISDNSGNTLVFKLHQYMLQKQTRAKKTSHMQCIHGVIFPLKSSVRVFLKAGQWEEKIWLCAYPLNISPKPDGYSTRPQKWPLCLTERNIHMRIHTHTTDQQKTADTYWVPQAPSYIPNPMLKCVEYTRVCG